MTDLNSADDEEFNWQIEEPGHAAGREQNDCFCCQLPAEAEHVLPGRAAAAHAEKERTVQTALTTVGAG